MLIRTQDKNGLVNLDNVDLITTGGGQNIIAHFAGSQPQSIGMYSSNKKALKVLDEIEDRYNNLEMAKANNNAKYFVPFVYEMPQEDEIK